MVAPNVRCLNAQHMLIEAERSINHVGSEKTPRHRRLTGY